MSQLISPTTSLSLALAVIAFAWLAWTWFRLQRLKKGVTSLTEALKRSPALSVSDLPGIADVEALQDLAMLTFNSVAEADLQRDSARGTQKIQTVLLDQVKDALLIVDEFQEIRFANAAAGNLFDTDQDPVGRQLIEVCLDHRFVDTVVLAMETGGPIQDRVRLTNKARTLFIEAGEVDPSYQIGDGAWLIISDITEELRTEQIRQDFVANASHELRTPLSIITGYLEMLENDPRHANAVNVMIKHTDRLNRIVDDMLMISRIESEDGSELQSRAYFDLGECVDDMLEQLQPVIDERDAKVKVVMPDDPADREFLGDRFYWDQIFFNLVENALKHNPQTGLKIKITVEKEAFTGRFNIFVTDNGVGIPTADLPEVFKRFYRVEKSHSRHKIKGTGLGLSIVKRAVEAHHGTITVTSRPGAKTTFHMSLPGVPITQTVKPLAPPP